MPSGNSDRKSEDAQAMAVGNISTAINNGIRVAIATPRQRQTQRTSFASQMKQGASRKASGSRNVAGPFIPGGGVLSAALSNVFGEIHDGVVEIEQQLKKSPDAGGSARTVIP